MKNEPRNIEGASILLAGASGVLGREIGHRLAEEGALLTLFGRDLDKLQKSGLSGPCVVGDIADAHACDEAVATAISTYGQIDGVVNATGVVAFGPLEEIQDETVNELITTNLLGPFRLMRAAAPEVERGGFLANLSAVVAERPTAGMAMYSASKAALSALDAALSRELRARRVDVLDIRPPHTETGLAERPIAGHAPKLAAGLDPVVVSEQVVDAIRSRSRELGAGDFRHARAS